MNPRVKVAGLAHRESHKGGGKWGIRKVCVALTGEDTIIGLLMCVHTSVTNVTTSLTFLL